MQSTAATIFSLSSADVSSILNLICRGCGGPLGALAEEYKCQGFCRREWRIAWVRGGPKYAQNNAKGSRSLKTLRLNCYKETARRHRS